MASDGRDDGSDERGDAVDVVAAGVVNGAAALNGSAPATVLNSGSAEGTEGDNEESGELGEHFWV